MRSDEERLRDILESCEAILAFLESLESRDALLTSRRDQNAILHELVIIGEAASHISEDIQRKYSGISWSAIKDFRNIIVHEYFGVDWDIVWEVITVRVPELAADIQRILSKA